ncbi:MAG: hypothetical protein J5824_05845 [Lachnospiraceae bacterium]|nr:hypothetical protein [Lachnospiraceae bacterium]
MKLGSKGGFIAHIKGNKNNFILTKKSRVLIALLLCFSLALCGCTGKSGGPNSDGQGNVGNAETGNGANKNDSDVNGSSKDNDVDRQGNSGNSDNSSGAGNDTGNNGGNASGNDTDNVNMSLTPISIDLSQTYQTMDGFGAAYTWYGERLLNAKDPEAGLDALFSDAKLTILRFKNEYGYHVEGKASNAVTMARNYKEARERAAEYGEKVIILMCCWSPPAFLKSDNSIAKGDGTLAKNADGEFVYDEYAKWWVDSIKYYKSYGIQIDYLSIQNEVDFPPDDYEGCQFGPKETATKASYAKAFIAVYDALHAEFGDDAPKMIGPESMSCTTADLLNYTRDILNERPEALEGVAYHLYVGGTGDSNTNTVKPGSFMTNFTGIKNYFGDIKRWQTEYYIGKGIQTSELLYYALTYADMTAYLYWSGVWDDSTPNRFEAFDLVEVNSAGKWRLTANYYAMRHYSQFIRPGYTRVDAKAEDSGVKACAFISPYKNKLAVVLVNNSDKEFTYRLAAEGYTITDSAMYLSEFGDNCESDEKCFQSIGAYDADKGITIPAKSVISVDITGYEGDKPVEVPPVTKIVYDNEVITEEIISETPTEGEKVLLSKDFSNSSDTAAFSGMGSGRGEYSDATGLDGAAGCMKVTGRSDTWNGVSLSSAYFEHYGYRMYVKYDCMMENGGNISLTPTFGCNGGTWYPSGVDDRVVCENMEPGKWYHVEGYMTLYTDMDQGSYSMYWEAPDGRDDFYLDNVEIKILYSEPVGEFAGG